MIRFLLIVSSPWVRRIVPLHTEVDRFAGERCGDRVAERGAADAAAVVFVDERVDGDREQPAIFERLEAERGDAALRAAPTTLDLGESDEAGTSRETSAWTCSNPPESANLREGALV